MATATLNLFKDWRRFFRDQKQEKLLRKNRENYDEKIKRECEKRFIKYQERFHHEAEEAINVSGHFADEAIGSHAKFVEKCLDSLHRAIKRIVRLDKLTDKHKNTIATVFFHCLELHAQTPTNPPTLSEVLLQVTYTYLNRNYLALQIPHLEDIISKAMSQAKFTETDKKSRKNYTSIKWNDQI